MKRKHSGYASSSKERKEKKQKIGCPDEELTYLVNDSFDHPERLTVNKKSYESYATDGPERSAAAWNKRVLEVSMDRVDNSLKKMAREYVCAYDAHESKTFTAIESAALNLLDNTKEGEAWKTTLEVDAEELWRSYTHSEACKIYAKKMLESASTGNIELYDAALAMYCVWRECCPAPTVPESWYRASMGENVWKVAEYAPLHAAVATPNNMLMVSHILMHDTLDTMIDKRYDRMAFPSDEVIRYIINQKDMETFYALDSRYNESPKEWYDGQVGRCLKLYYGITDKIVTKSDVYTHVRRLILCDDSEHE